jgi:hypothetical protein
VALIAADSRRSIPNSRWRFILVLESRDVREGGDASRAAHIPPQALRAACPLPRMKILVLHSVPSPIASHIRTLAVLPTDKGRMEAEGAAGIGLREGASRAPELRTAPIRGASDRWSESAGWLPRGAEFDPFPARA